MSHFSRPTLRKLARKGISIMGTTLIPDPTAALPFASGETAYVVNDNGFGKVWTFQQVLEAAG